MGAYKNQPRWQPPSRHPDAGPSSSSGDHFAREHFSTDVRHQRAPFPGATANDQGFEGHDQATGRSDMFEKSELNPSRDLNERGWDRGGIPVWERDRSMRAGFQLRDDDKKPDKHRGKGPRGYKRSDSRIAEDVNDRLSEDPFLDATDIEVTVKSGEVTLEGSVRDRMGKRRAEDIAESVRGVANVVNRIRVSPERDGRESGSGGPIGDNRGEAIGPKR